MAVKPVTEFSPRAFLHQPIPPPPAKILLSTPTQQPRFSVLVEPNKVISNCLWHIKFHLLARRRTLIPASHVPVPDLCDIEGYVASQIINPIIHCINVLTDKVYYNTLEYRVQNTNDHTDQLSCVRVDISNREADVKFPVFFFLPHTSLQNIQADSTAESAQHSLPKSAVPDSVGLLLQQGIPVVLTDFPTTMLITKMDKDNAVLHCEVSAVSPSFPLRHILAGFIAQRLPRNQLDLDVETPFKTEGAPNSPDIPTPSDEQVFATRKRHADFDRYVMETSRPAFDQFLRWKDHMRARVKPVLVGAAVQGETNAFAAHRVPARPRYALEPLPAETDAYMRAIQRRAFPRFAQTLRGSARFSLVLGEELTPADGTSYARTFACSVGAVDGRSAAAAESDGCDVPPRLCVKLYDDGAARVPDLKDAGSPFFWMQQFYTAETMLRVEEDAYVRLEHAWGSVVPWFYGTHRFTLPDGRTAFGLLTEYVNKSETRLRDHPGAAQISFIQSARHAIRVLQRADISQYDWCSGQWIVAPYPGSSDHAGPSLACVLVDFALTSQGDVWSDALKQDDWGDMADALYLDKPEDAQMDGVSRALLKQWYAPREEWDFMRSSWVMDMMEMKAQRQAMREQTGV